MRINPVSFGRAVKVNGPCAIADRIANYANADKYDMAYCTDEEKAMCDFSKRIFSDITSDAKAKVFSIKPGEFYILSGIERKIADCIEKDRNNNLEYLNYWVEHKKIKEEAAEKQRIAIWENRNQKLTNLFENSEDGKKKSEIDVEYEDREFGGLKIDYMLYTSASPNYQEYGVFNRNKNK